MNAAKQYIKEVMDKLRTKEASQTEKYLAKWITALEDVLFVLHIFFEVSFCDPFSNRKLLEKTDFETEEEKTNFYTKHIKSLRKHLFSISIV